MKRFLPGLLVVAFLCAESVLATRIEMRDLTDRPTLARNVAIRAEEALAKLETRFALSIRERISVVLVSNPGQLELTQPAGSPPPTWAAGVAWPELNLIILKTRDYDGDPEEVVGHEMVHIVLGRLFGSRTVPDWLHESLAMHLSGEWGLGRQLVMARALAADRLIPLERLVHGFPAERAAAELAYAQSYYFMAFLEDRYGPVRVGRLIRNLSLGITIEHAWIDATGRTRPELEEEFHRWLAGRFPAWWLLTEPDWLWALAALLVVFGALVKRRGNARRLAAWSQEDEGDDDSGGPGGGGPEGRDYYSLRKVGRRRIRRRLRSVPAPRSRSADHRPPPGYSGPD